MASDSIKLALNRAFPVPADAPIRVLAGATMNPAVVARRDLEAAIEKATQPGALVTAVQVNAVVNAAKAAAPYASAQALKDVLTAFEQSTDQFMDAGAKKSLASFGATPAATTRANQVAIAARAALNKLFG